MEKSKTKQIDINAPFQESQTIEQYEVYSEPHVIKNKGLGHQKFMPKKKDIFGDPSKSFRLGIIASSNSGKSHLLNTLLNDPDFNLLVSNSGKPKFSPDKVFVFSPTIELDDSYQQTIQTLKRLSTKDNQFEKSTQFFTTDLDANFNMIFDQIEEDQKGKKLAKLKLENYLIILDDILGQMQYASNNSFLSTVFTRARHYQCSLIVSVQKYRSISNTIKVNLSSIILFSVTQNSELKALMDETSSSLDKKKWLNIYNFATNEQYGYLLIMLSYPQSYRFFAGNGSNIQQLQI